MESIPSNRVTVSDTNNKPFNVRPFKNRSPLIGSLFQIKERRSYDLDLTIESIPSNRVTVSDKRRRAPGMPGF